MVKPPSGGFLLLIERVDGGFREDSGTPEQWGDARAATLTTNTHILRRSLCSSHCDLRRGRETCIDADCWDQWPKGEPEMSARTPAPKTMDYSVVPGSIGPRRDFRISVGLREGWDAEGRVFDVSEAVRTARAWMKRRVEAGLPALSGMFTRAEVTYAWPRPDGTVGSDREPVALFTGEAVHAYLGHLSDETIEAMLNELSIELGAALGQERIYVAFADRTWILDAGER